MGRMTPSNLIQSIVNLTGEFLPTFAFTGRARQMIRKVDDNFRRSSHVPSPSTRFVFSVQLAGSLFGCVLLLVFLSNTQCWFMQRILDV